MLKFQTATKSLKFNRLAKKQKNEYPAFPHGSQYPPIGLAEVGVWLRSGENCKSSSVLNFPDHTVMCSNKEKKKQSKGYKIFNFLTAKKL